ncbi:hypothetical protein V6N11_058738 [Hibiscus sabdariffa]|uniref:Hexosyltransferase n=1 Tax=Hibiscus sabdariffa TaxID=183260 RepID=A0ABR2U553_9ROSI
MCTHPRTKPSLLRPTMSSTIPSYVSGSLWSIPKMIYLDGDIQVFETIDHLFDMEDGYFYAVMDCFCEKTNPDKVHWPYELGPKPPLYFNAGMFVYELSLTVYEDLLATLKVTPPCPTPFAEQDYI